MAHLLTVALAPVQAELADVVKRLDGLELAERDRAHAAELAAAARARHRSIEARILTGLQTATAVAAVYVGVRYGAGQ